MEGLASAVLVLLTVVIHIWCGEIGAPWTYGEQHSAVLKAQERKRERRAEEKKGKESRGEQKKRKSEMRGQRSRGGE